MFTKYIDSFIVKEHFANPDNTREGFNLDEYFGLVFQKDCQFIWYCLHLKFKCSGLEVLSIDIDLWIMLFCCGSHVRLGTNSFSDTEIMYFVVLFFYYLY